MGRINVAYAIFEGPSGPNNEYLSKKEVIANACCESVTSISPSHVDRKALVAVKVDQS